MIFILPNGVILLVEWHPFLSDNINVKKNNNTNNIYILMSQVWRSVLLFIILLGTEKMFVPFYIIIKAT